MEGADSQQTAEDGDGGGELHDQLWKLSVEIGIRKPEKVRLRFLFFDSTNIYTTKGT